VRVRLLIALAALLLGAPRASADDFTLIRNTKNPIAELSRADLKGLAVGKKKTWPSGPVAVLVLPRPGTPELRWFAATVGVPESVLMSRIKELVFRGEIRKPIIVGSPEEMLAAMRTETGCLGVVTAAAAKNLPEGVGPVFLR
jgi:hypothetical protein